MSSRFTPLLILVLGSSCFADDTERTLFVFDNPDAEREWRVLRSSGNFKLTDKKTMEFYGTLTNESECTLERAEEKKLDFERGDVIVARVRGDGRTYTLGLYPRQGKRKLVRSYGKSFKTKKDEWQEVRVPLDRLEPLDRIPVGGAPDPDKIYRLGFITDGTTGPFNLEIEWVKVIRAKPDE